MSAFGGKADEDHSPTEGLLVARSRLSPLNGSRGYPHCNAVVIRINGIHPAVMPQPELRLPGHHLQLVKIGSTFSCWGEIQDLVCISLLRMAPTDGVAMWMTAATVEQGRESAPGYKPKFSGSS